MSEKNAGWGKVSSLQKKFCFYPEGKDESLCRKTTRFWGWGRLFGPNDFVDADHDHPDNCAACKKKHAKLYPEAGHA